MLGLRHRRLGGAGGHTVKQAKSKAEIEGREHTRNPAHKKKQGEGSQGGRMAVERTAQTPKVSSNTLPNNPTSLTKSIYSLSNGTFGSNWQLLSQRGMILQIQSYICHSRQTCWGSSWICCATKYIRDPNSCFARSLLTCCCWREFEQSRRIPWPCS